MRVLTVVHGFPPHAMGGAEVYAHTLAQELAASHAVQVSVLTRHADPETPEYDVVDEMRQGLRVISINNTFRACTSFEDSYRHERIRAMAADVIDEVRPDVAHLHHLTCLSTEIVSELARRGIPIVFTLHDYWLICHRGQLLDLDYQLCAGPYDAGCKRCIGVVGTDSPAMSTLLRAYRAVEQRLPVPAAAGLRYVAQSAVRTADQWSASGAESLTRLSHMRAMCEPVATFLAPSRTMMEYFAQFGIPSHKIQYWPYGFDPAPFHLKRSSSELLRIGFLGSLMVSKAPHVVLDAVAGLPADRVSLSLYGRYSGYHGDDRYRSEIDRRIAAGRLTFCGSIAHDDIPSALASMDVLVVPSIWPENAPLVISEAFLAGIPVLGSNIGGVAEMITHEINGLLFTPGDSDDLRRCLQRLLDEPGLLQRLRTGLPSVRAVADDASHTYTLYESLAASQPLAPALSAVSITQRRRIAAVVLNYKTPTDTLLAVKALRASRRPIDEIIVVDNASGDDSVPRFRQELTGAALIESPTNLGFSGGCNEGIRVALANGADSVFLVNSDTIVPPDTVQELECAMEARSDVGIVAPLILSRNDPSQIGSAGMSYSRLTGRMRHAGFGQSFDNAKAPSPIVVDGVSGCAMLIKRDVFDRIGLFDIDYFFTFEDLDFCLRAWRHGLNTLCVPAAVVYHEGSRSIGRESASRIYYAVRNHLLMAKRALPSRNPVRRLTQTAGILTVNLAYVLLSSEAPLRPGLRALAKGAVDYWRGRYGNMVRRPTS